MIALTLAIRGDLHIARGLPLADECHALADVAAALSPRRQNQIGGGNHRHFDVEVDTVEWRPGNTRPVVGAAAGVRLATAGIAEFVRPPAAARIHCCHHMNADGHAMIGAGDLYFAGFHWLAQLVERLRLEFRQFIEKQRAVMGERDLPGARMQAAARIIHERI